jgi:hypothetical protein
MGERHLILLRFRLLSEFSPNPETLLGMPKLILISLVLISLCSLVFASDWKREVNGRWGFALTYPASLIPEAVSSNGAGRRYHSADHEVSLAVMGSHTHPEEFLDNFWQKEQVEIRTVPRTGDPGALNVAFRQRSATVRAGVADGMVSSLHIEEGYFLALDCERSRLAGWHVLGLSYLEKFCHNA